MPLLSLRKPFQWVGAPSAFVALSLVLASCSGSDASGPSIDTTPRITAVSVTPGSPTVAVGDQAQLTANVTALNGASTAVAWSSSNAAIVSVGTTGLITGVAAGTASVTATSVTDPTKSATVSVTVNAAPPAVVSVVVTPPNPTLVVGDLLELRADVSVESGASTAVTWSTSDATVATVSAAGQITALAAGTVTITATSVFDETKRGSVRLTVSPEPVVVSITVANAPAALIVGTSAQLTATVVVAGGASTAVTWTSSAPEIATVSPSGLVSAVAPGNATITATSVVDPTKQGSATVRIDAAANVLSVTVGPATLSLSVGTTGQLTATVTVSGNASQQVIWSSSTPSIATVDQTGKVTALAAGTATIRATAVADATRFGASVVTVTAPQFPGVAQVNAREDIVFSPESVDIARGGTVTWVFGGVTHNVTFTGTTGAPAGIGNTTNASATRTFATAGTFNYECTIHAGMRGTVVVH